MESLTEDLQLKAIFTRGRDDRQRTTHPAPSAPLMRGTWIRDRLIGRSPFGSVWLENHKDPSRTVAIRAVKQIPKTSFRNLIERELQAMAKFSREPVWRRSAPIKQPLTIPSAVHHLLRLVRQRDPSIYRNGVLRIRRLESVSCRSWTAGRDYGAQHHTAGIGRLGIHAPKQLRTS